MIPFSLALGIAGYGAAAAVYLAVLTLVLPSRPDTLQARRFLAALGVSVLWASVLAVALYRHAGLRPWMLVADAVRTAAWIVFTAGLLRARSESGEGVRLGNLLRVAAVVLCALVGLAAYIDSEGRSAAGGGQTLALAMLALPIIGLLGLEQLFRNSLFKQRPVLNPLCIGIGLIFAIDVFVFSEALLFARVNPLLWQLRGLANLAAAPVLLLAVKQQPDWGRDVFVSRHVVFYGTSLAAAGLYLLAMAAGGYFIAASGARWGPLLNLLFFLSAGAVLFYGLFSVQARRRLKVFIAKHFYRNRYDYREEWLRLIETLAGGNDAASLPERSVKALAEIIGSSRGELWLVDRAGRRYEPYGAWGLPSTSLELTNEDALVRFLGATHWVVDTKEYLDDPEKYSNAFASDQRHMERPAIFVPLIRAGALTGIVRLERPPGLVPLSYEDHDLLKTAGQQVAIFLEQERAQEELSETRQFEAFSRLTAFLMHDLKNLIAQQELVVGNAQRFKHRPEFIEDAVRTIEAGVQRMKRVLERLQSAGGHDHTSLVNVEKVLQEVCAACADREPVPRLREGAASVRVAMDRDKLSMAVTHAVRNAQDATRPDGRIELRLSNDGGLAWIEVEDSGSGMDPDFVRDQLFKPFHSTKGAKGMGIGAYQIRETLRAAGGNVEVSSEVGKGTTVRMAVPLAPAVDAPAGRSAA